MQLSGYLELLKKRSGNRRITRSHQLAGLEIAELLGDNPHRSLYIKLAKSYGSSRVLAIAKEVAERTGIRNRAAYFMRVLQSELPTAPKRPANKIARKHKRASDV